ncbi:GNAT family N-acetyltransferase [Reinekea blandensis]|uniref:Histone acetyltransferase HPA2/related acetyltransferase n=1 Tax=Reinekea blandensis MED297 TaxID=314283 RepID=A4BJP0_9GAMM|nr:GNAT family N-acetyltransferase [Reinekea blandensis]EAR07680.1 Histone acetyltransferase HPA2/related acetyltransferase [Reinekea sp. MED297] [Reinekea blandensis MED297]
MTQTPFNVRPYQPDDRDALLNLAVHDEQIPFVGHMADLLAANSATRHPFVLETNGTLVGFFHIDTGYADEYDFAHAGDVGLRAFLIDHRHQGNGFGRQTMTHLPRLMQTHFPHAKRLVLTVNCKNPTAYQLYCRNGFIDDGELYHGGAAGPQHVLRMPL